jgi:multidrug efflux pump subunit AcrA (membrane-fusion protein)
VQTQSADLGQFVTPGKVLGTVFGTDAAEVRLAFTDNQLSVLGIPIGFVGDGRDDLTTTLSAVAGGQMYQWQGRLTRLDAAIDPTTRTVYGTVRIDQPYNLEDGREMPLAVGLYVDAEVEGRLAFDAIQIAAEGLRAGDEVFVLNGEGLLDVRQVSVLHRNRDTVLLASGVEAGDRIIVSAIRNPIRGMRLEAIDDAGWAESQSANEPVTDDEA